MDALLELLPKYRCHGRRNTLRMSDFLRENFKQYISDLRIATSSKDNPLLGADICEKINFTIEEISENSDAIVDVFDVYNHGKIIEASNIAFSVLDRMRPYLLHRVSHMYDMEQYYRIRKYSQEAGSGAFPLVRKEMFHIPYAINYKVGPERYSLPGHPCLYLSSQAELAWYECGKPDKFAIARYSIPKKEDNHLKLIDFSEKLMPMKFDFISWLYGAKDKEPILDYLLKNIYMYPLRAACSVPTEHPEGNFKEEYIMPQILMQWISSKGDYDGVRYESCLKDDVVHCMGGHNIVLVTKDFDCDGYDIHLRKNLRVGSPVLIDNNLVPYNPDTRQCDGTGGLPDPFHWNMGNIPDDYESI